MGSYLSIENDTTDTWSVKLSSDSAAFDVGAFVNGIAGAVAGFIGGGLLGAAAGAAAANAGLSFLRNKLTDEGFHILYPGERKTFGKMTCSLWQQGTCVRTKKTGAKVISDTVYMRPIFSGATDDSINNHTIQFWINRHGLENHTETHCG